MPSRAARALRPRGVAQGGAPGGAGGLSESVARAVREALLGLLRCRAPAVLPWHRKARARRGAQPGRGRDRLHAAPATCARTGPVTGAPAGRAGGGRAARPERGRGRGRGAAQGGAAGMVAP